MTLERPEEDVKDVFSSGKYAEYLAVMSRFHSYSLNNCSFIAMQRPEATLVAGHRAWQNKFGRYVYKGEHGIKILCPVFVRAKPEGGGRAGQGEDPSPTAVRERRRRKVPLDEICNASHRIINVIEGEASKARKPGERGHAKETEKVLGCGSRRPTERAGAARAASAESRAPKRAVEASR